MGRCERAAAAPVLVPKYQVQPFVAGFLGKANPWHGTDDVLTGQY